MSYNHKNPHTESERERDTHTDQLQATGVAGTVRVTSDLPVLTLHCTVVTHDTFLPYFSGQA